MNKEEIREGMYKIVREHTVGHQYADKCVLALHSFLDQENVRIVKEIKIPEVEEDCPFERLDEQAKMLKAFNESLERLI